MKLEITGKKERKIIDMELSNDFPFFYCKIWNLLKSLKLVEINQENTLGREKEGRNPREKGKEAKGR